MSGHGRPWQEPQRQSGGTTLNGPGWVALSGRDARVAGEWYPVLAPTTVQPDGRHRFQLYSAGRETTHVRLDICPTVLRAGLRVWGYLTGDGERALRDCWNSLGR